MNIKVLGGGCDKCITLYGYVEEIVKELGMDAELEKVTEFRDIVTLGVLKTPALMVDGVVKIAGRMPSKDEVKKILSK